MTESSQELPKWLELEEGYAASFKNPVLQVWKKDTPELRFSFSTEKEHSPAKSFYVAFEGFKATEEQYNKSLEVLEKQHGFRLERSDAELLLSQKDYGITERIPADGSLSPAECAKRIQDIVSRAEEKWLEAEEVYEQLPKNGFTKTNEVTQEGITTETWSHDTLPSPITVTLHGELKRLDKAGMETIERVIKQLHTPSPVTSTKKERTTPQSKVPPKQQATLVFDSSIFNAHNQTLLDMISLSTAHPGVADVVIPSIVADWELRGRITYTDKEGKLVTLRADEEFNDPKNSKFSLKKGRDSLLSEASRYRLDSTTGEQCLVTQGSNPHLIICETDIDRHFMRAAKEIMDNPKLTAPYKPVAIRNLADKMAKDYWNHTGADLGELSMLAAARQWNAAGQAYLICNDITFLRQLPTDLLTKNGMPIGDAKLRGYLKAELDSRGEVIRPLLGLDSTTSAEDIELKILKGQQDNARLQHGYADERAGNFKDEHGNLRSGSTLSELMLAAADKGQSIAPKLPGYKPKPKKEVTATHIVAVGDAGNIKEREELTDTDIAETTSPPESETPKPVTIHEINALRASLADLVVDRDDKKINIQEIAEQIDEKATRVSQILSSRSRKMPTLSADDICRISKKITEKLTETGTDEAYTNLFSLKAQMLALKVTAIQKSTQDIRASL